MDYREYPPPLALAGLVKTFWTLEATGAEGDWLDQRATPDGCIEMIRRLKGHSRWDGDQPATFAVGLVDAPTTFATSANARFAAIRVWPWAWPLISDVPLREMAGRWIPFDHPLLDALPDIGAAAILVPACEERRRVGLAVIDAATVGEMGRRAGMSPRTLQRWFASNVGMNPRRYLRLLRFQKAFEQIPSAASLAGHAFAQGFADQSHMSREFRRMAGVPAAAARRDARGPFLP